jgi:hypothetical protein
MKEVISFLSFNNSDMPRIKKAVPTKYMVDTLIQYNVDVSLWKSKIKQKISNFIFEFKHDHLSQS